jgi:hypothetical protein
MQVDPGGERMERPGYRDIFVPLNAGNRSNTGVAIAKCAVARACYGRSVTAISEAVPTETEEIEKRDSPCYFADFALMPLKASVRRDL